MSDDFVISSTGTYQTNSVTDIELLYHPSAGLAPGTKLWLLYGIWNDAGQVQCENERGENFISGRGSGNESIEVRVHGIRRTLDLYPEVPAFFVLTEFTVGSGGLPAGESLEITIKRWQTSSFPVKQFHFWLVVDAKASWDFVTFGYRAYLKFINRHTGERIDPETVAKHLFSVSIEVRGEYRAVPAINHRKTPGVLWGELHGMALNQRPLNDFYDYAKNVADLDFCSALLLSYNTCVGDVWQEIKEAAKRHTVPGKFVAFAGFECGTPPDDSHRCAYFPQAENVPPIFCDSRPPALDPMLQKRFHPDTIFCRTLDEFYSTIERFGGFVGGHFHTRSYDRELLAEIWQKHEFPRDEEGRIFGYMREGKHFGLVGGSDTHGSMPGNPYPELWLPRQAGFTGVWAEELTAQALAEAFRARRVFATSGARMVIRFDSNGHPMGSELPLEAARVFNIFVDGTNDLSSVELLRDGHPLKTWCPRRSKFETEFEAPEESFRTRRFYLVRVKQRDGYLGWSSPIWFG